MFEGRRCSVTRMEGCDFCAIVHGHAPAEVIAEFPEALAFFPLRPAALGHTLVIPKKHVDTIWDTDAHTVQVVAEATRLLSIAVHTELDPDGLNIIHSTGTAATQTVYHLHFHVVPRWRDDKFGNIWPLGNTLDYCANKRIADQLRRAMKTAMSN